jgi:hypothetical protein
MDVHDNTQRITQCFAIPLGHTHIHTHAHNNSSRGNEVDGQSIVVCCPPPHHTTTTPLASLATSCSISSPSTCSSTKQRHRLVATSTTQHYSTMLRFTSAMLSSPSTSGSTSSSHTRDSAAAASANATSATNSEAFDTRVVPHQTSLSASTCPLFDNLPLPTHWSNSDRSKHLELSHSYLRIAYKGLSTSSTARDATPQHHQWRQKQQQQQQ